MEMGHLETGKEEQQDIYPILEGGGEGGGDLMEEAAQTSLLYGVPRRFSRSSQHCHNWRIFLSSKVVPFSSLGSDSQSE